MSGAQSSVSIADLPLSSREKSSSSVYLPKIFPLLSPPGTVEDKMCSRLDCFAALAKVRCHCLDVVQISVERSHAGTKLCENTRLSLAEVVVHAPSVISRPGSVDSA